MKIILEIRPPEMQQQYLRGVEDISCTGFEESLFDCTFFIEYESVQINSIAQLNCNGELLACATLSLKSIDIKIHAPMSLMATYGRCVCVCVCLDVYVHVRCWSVMWPTKAE